MARKDYDVIVIGGGAAGMMAAGRAGEHGKRVLLLERNKRLGEKLRISGGGRCNITNAEQDEKKLLAKYGKAEQFLYSAYAQFGVSDTFSFFESRGLPLKVEANDRAFPVSDKAADVVAVLEQYLATGKVTMRMGVPKVEVLVEGKSVSGVRVGKEVLTADSYVLATGGVSHPETGSTGDGFAWLRTLGHTVENPTPTIVPLKVKEKWVADVAGVTLGDVKLSFYMNDKKKLSRKGSVLFTHFGISGPTVLNAAGAVADLLHEGSVEARIDLFPQLDLGILDAHITAHFDARKNKLVRNALAELVPARFVPIIFAHLPELAPDRKVHSVLREERRQIADFLKSVPLTVTGLMGFDRAVVADGGVLLSEVDTRTMRSRRYPNLYIVGDLLHISRPSGGYSLQLCWTTGFVAGNSC